MVEVEECYQVIISKDKLQASIKQISKRNEEMKITLDDLKRLLHDHNVIYGIDESALNIFVSTPIISKEVVVAKGKKPENGQDAYLKPILHELEEKDFDSYENVDMRKVTEIPVVKTGEKVAEKIEATSGEDGTDVHNEPIPAKPGRDFKLLKGKNTEVSKNELELYSLISGQISIDKNTVHVHPTYEIKGDLSMKTGNIDFVGNVIINGNVPAGYTVKAGGDIRIKGTVEAATIFSGGSIFIGSGVVGQNKCLLEAKNDIKASFINEGVVKAGGTIEVTQTILHSTVTTEKMIICKRGRGLIVGGAISAVEAIIAKEIGNEMQTETSLFIGVSKKNLDEHRQIEKELNQINDSLKKLSQLLRTYLLKEKNEGTLVGKEKHIKMKVLNSYQESQEKKQSLEVKFKKLNELTQKNGTGYVTAERKMYSNVVLNFGKYQRRVRSNYLGTTARLDKGEITITTH
ncbi:DUF342 domain-containing protein [Bacillus sp. JCM 19034]|uniref:DUF342 domain-containing protein n=1 Tax=Bacillus sp. JCM 19034 TaxID=1481928 RepID=UPI001E57DE61|nr:FapA family protein [Bacillus sp. JCM 19034]